MFFYAPGVHAWNACRIGPRRSDDCAAWNALLLSRVSVSLYGEENELSGKMLIKHLQSFNTLILIPKLIGKRYKAIYRLSVETVRTRMVADTFITRCLDQTFGPHNNSTKKILLWSPKCMWGIWGAVKWGSLCRVTELLCDTQDHSQSVLGVCAMLCCLFSIALITCYIICYVTCHITVYITYVIYLMLCCF